MNETYLRLAIEALLPAVLSVFVYFLNRIKPLGKVNGKLKQIVIGVFFGVLAVLNTEWGGADAGSAITCRDAAVLSAGLMFGAPAGLTAGLIAGIEIWLSALWSNSAFTWLAGSLSAIVAGIYAALLRRYMFEDKKPGWLISLAIGVVMEILYLTLVFTTRLNHTAEATEVVKTSTTPSLIANGLSVMLSSVLLSAASKERVSEIKSEHARISQTIQRWLLIAVFMAFSVTSLFVFVLQNKIAQSQTDSLLSIAIQEIADDVNDVSDQNLLNLTQLVAADIDNGLTLKEVAEKYNVAEVSVINSDGIIEKTTEHRFLGYRMDSGAQSAEFLCLLNDATEYVQPYQPIAYDGVTMRKYAGVKTDGGFVQVGYDAEHFQADIDASVLGITKNRHIGKTGYVLILDSRLNPVSLPQGHTFNPEDAERATENPQKENTTFLIEAGGTNKYCRYQKTEGYYIVAVLPEAEALQTRNVAIYVNTFLEILIFAILFTLIFVLVRITVVNRIKEVDKSLAEITAGNLDEVVNVRSSEEFASLSDGINETVSTLKHYIAEASARIDKELELAQSIQSSVLPNVDQSFTSRKDFDIYALMDPAKEVGGDFYDFYLLHEDTLNFLVADVSGKGIPAAMFMMRAKTELKSLTESGHSINEVFKRGNNALCEGNDTGVFVTAWQGCLNLSTGCVQFANAGHNPPLVKHADGKFEFLRTKPGLVLAGMEGISYRTEELKLQEGDVIFLYTDGVTEATNGSLELYGNDRLLDIINRIPNTDMQTLCRMVKDDVDAFVGDAPQFDDITMVALRYNGSVSVPSIYRERATVEDIPTVTDFVCDELQKLDCPGKLIVQFSIVVDEIYSNIVRYGYAMNPGPIQVEVFKKENPDAFYLRFTDEGMPYNPLKKDDPNVKLSAEERSIGGLGVFMVKKSMDDMRYEYNNEKNILTIQKLL